jgi:hypothetical protein
MPGRRPPTIDVIASEIERWPVTREASQSRAGSGDDAHAPGAESTAAAGSSAGGGAPPDPPAAGATENAASHAAPEDSRVPPRRGFRALGVIGGGLIGAAAGAALALLVADRLPLRDSGASGLDARLARAEQLLHDIAARPQPASPAALAELAGRVMQIETRPPPAPASAAPDPAIADRLGALEGETRTLRQRIGAVDQRVEEAAASARRAGEGAAAIADLTRRVGGAASRADLDALAARVAELAKRPPDGSDRAARLALAASVLQTTIMRGEPFAAELAAVQALAPDPAPDPALLAALAPFAETGVPTAASLARELTALTPELLAAAGSAPREGSFLERLQANAEKIVRIRPLEETPGDDLAAIVARIEVKASRHDLAGALAELARLPVAARAPAEPWIRKVAARQAALEASRRLAADSIAGLRP